MTRNKGRELQVQAEVTNGSNKKHDSLAAVSSALTLLSNAVMAWNTMHMQRAVEEIEARSGQAVVAGLRRIAPTHFDGINLRGTFDFPLAPYAHRMLSSSTPYPTTYRRFSA